MRVSAIVPTYNCGPWLKECIDSILRQDAPVMELIIVDDGSTDDTARIVQACGDKRIRYFRQDHAGLSRTRNVGLAKARGDFLAFLDADDLWPSNYLGEMLAHLERSPNCGLAYCEVLHIHPDGRQEECYPSESYPSGRITCQMFQRFLVWVQGCVMRRACMDGMWFDERFSFGTGEDIDLLLRLSLRTSFLFVPSVRITRRIRRESLSQNPDHFRFRMNMVKGIRVYERFYHRLGGKDCIPARLARGYLSRTYTRHAGKYRISDARRASLALYREAIRYSWLSRRAWWGLARAWAMPKRRDALPDWQMPQHLPDEIMHVPEPRAMETANSVND